jgi:hypothetical protein
MFNLEEYTTVRERIQLFWEKYPNGRLFTEILDWSDKRFIVKASVYADRGDAFPIATGLANEIVGSSNVNRDFALENCSTSSLGIAIGNAGLGIDKQKASRTEMAKVVAMSKPKPAVQDLVQAIKAADAEPAEQDYWTTPVSEYMKVVDAPVTLEKAMDTVMTIIGTPEAAEVPQCKHGSMVWKQGKKKTGGDWYAYQCTALGHAGYEGKCPAVWYEMRSDGKVVPQKARV